jgi:hypothetical protein
MTIAVDQVPEAALRVMGKLLRQAGVHWRPSLGMMVAPSPRASAKEQRANPGALRITHGGWWFDRHTGKSGDDVPSLLAYAAYSDHGTVLRRLAAELMPSDLHLDEAVRQTPRQNPYDRSKRKVASVRGEAQQFDDQLRKFVARPVSAKLKADALVQAAWNASAADRSGRR